MQPNPLAAFGQDSAAPPAFDRIRPEHVVPAIEGIVADHTAAMAQCRAMPGDPAMLRRKEAADLALGHAWGLVGHLLGVASTPELREAHAAAQALITAYFAALGQDKALYAALAAIDAAALGPVEQRALELALQRFRLAGVALEGEAAARFAANVQESSRLSTAFSNAVLDATQAWTLDIADRAALRGVPEADLAGMARAAQDAGVAGWRITLHAPSVMAIMMHAEDRELRRRVYEANGTRASDQGPDAGRFDNSANIRALLRLRAEQAMALGFADPVERSLATKMAPGAQEVEEFLLRLARLARPKAQADLEELRRFAAQELGIADLMPWDMGFAAERLRRASHALDSGEIRRHLPLDRVMAALFDLVGDLFGIELRQRSDVPVWHEDVRHYEVFARGAPADAVPIAGFYADMYARNGKRGGAWMDVCRARGDNGAIWPLAYLVTNFPAPAQGESATINHGDMVTLFHELGHVLNHLLSAVDVPSVAGISGVEWDAVELPSQFLENFAWEPAILKAASAHVETGEPLDEDLIARMLGARQFQKGLGLLRQAELSLFDLRLRASAGGANSPDVQAVLEAVRDEIAVVRPPEWHRFAHSFSHIFAGGYAAGYYSYLWAERLSADAYAAFGEPGADRAALGARFRDEVLARGGSRPAAQNFAAFRGREPADEPLLAAWGIAA